MTAILGIPPPGPVWRCEPTADDLDDLTAVIRVWLTQQENPMAPKDASGHDEDEGRIYTPEEIAQAQAEVDAEIEQRREAWAWGAEKRRKRERDLYG